MKSSAYIQQITSLTKDDSNLLYPCTMYYVYHSYISNDIRPIRPTIGNKIEYKNRH